MASDKDFVEYIVEQISEIGIVSYKKMFGEYGLYLNGKIVALICDNKLFVKPTEKGRKFIGEVIEAPPYPGAKNSFLIEENLDDSDWLSHLILESYQELPEMKPKKKKGI